MSDLMGDDESLYQFKDRLYQSFKETGMLDSVKAQLRHKMIEKLVKSQRVNQMQQKHVEDKNQHKQLTLRLMASIVSEYLEKEELNYSNSIFLPESGYANKNLQRFEIIDIMNAKNIDNPQTSILESMVNMYLSNIKNIPKQNCSTQTEHADAIFNLEQRLNTVDNKFREKLQEINTPSHEIEERLTRSKRDFEARLKGEMNAEIVRIREFELSTIKMEEQEKHRKSMEEYRVEIEKSYRDKLNKLRERESTAIEKVEQKMKEIETVNHSNRQRIMKDFELLRLREEEVDKQRQLNEEIIRVHKQKLDNYEIELKDKIKKAEDSQLIVEKKYQNDLAYTKLEAHRDLESEKLEILEKRRALDEDLYKIKQMKDTVTQFTEQNKKLAEDNRRYADELLEVKRKKKEMDLELSQLRDNMRSVSDSYKRDQDSSRNTEQKLKLMDDKVAFYKDALEESKKLADSYKQESMENFKKFNNEISIYQEKIEQLERQIKELKKQNSENEFQLEQFRRQVVIGAQPNSEIASHHNAGGLTSFKPSFSKELDELREKRRQELQFLQKQSDFIEKKHQNVKFDNIWDISNASIDFSQLKPQQRETNNADHDRNKSQIYGDIAGDKRYKGTNLIEESFREENNYDKLRDSRDSERNDLNSSSRLRVLSEIEKSRRNSVNPKEQQSQQTKEVGNSNFMIKKTIQSPKRTKEAVTHHQVEESSLDHFQQKGNLSKQSAPLPSELKKDEFKPKKNITKEASSLPFGSQKGKQSDWTFEDVHDDFDDLSRKRKEEQPSWKQSEVKPAFIPKKDISNPFSKKSDEFDFDSNKDDDLLGFGKKKETKGAKVDPFSAKYNEFSLPSVSKHLAPIESKPAWPPLKQEKTSLEVKNKNTDDYSISEHFDEIEDYDPIEEDEDMLPI